MAARADRPDDDAVEPDPSASSTPPGAASADASADASEPHRAPDEHVPTEDEEWASLVERLGDLDASVADGTRADDPSSTATGGPGTATPGEVTSYPVAPWVQRPRTVRPAAESRPASGRDWDGTGQIDDAESEVDAQEHFVPSDPGPVLGGDPLLTMAWLVVVGMPLFLFAVLIAWRSAPLAIVEAACVVLFLGVGVLLWRMPHRREDDDDDTGAVV